jgi:hypothetical protein
MALLSRRRERRPSKAWAESGVPKLELGNEGGKCKLENEGVPGRTRRSAPTEDEQIRANTKSFFLHDTCAKNFKLLLAKGVNLSEFL